MPVAVGPVPAGAAAAVPARPTEWVAESRASAALRVWAAPTELVARWGLAALSSMSGARPVSAVHQTWEGPVVSSVPQACRVRFRARTRDRATAPTANRPVTWNVRAAGSADLKSANASRSCRARTRSYSRPMAGPLMAGSSPALETPIARTCCMGFASCTRMGSASIRSQSARAVASGTKSAGRDRFACAVIRWARASRQVAEATRTAEIWRVPPPTPIRVACVLQWSLPASSRRMLAPGAWTAPGPMSNAPSRLPAATAATSANAAGLSWWTVSRDSRRSSTIAPVGARPFLE